MPGVEKIAVVSIKPRFFNIITNHFLFRLRAQIRALVLLL